MRVLLFANHLRGPDLSGGARSWHQARFLAERAEVTAIVPRVDPLTSVPVEEDPFPDLPTFRLRVGNSTFPQRHSMLGRALYHLSCVAGQAMACIEMQRPDVILCMYAPVTSALVPVALARVLGVPLVLDVRDLPTETALEIGYLREGPLVGLLSNLESGVLRIADQVVTVSAGMVPFLTRKGADPSRIHVAPIGYDGFLEPGPEEVDRERQGLLSLFDERPETLALFSGTLGHIADLDTVLQAAGALREPREVGIVALGSGQRLQEYQERAARQGLPVRFLGRVPKARVHRACRAVDICLFPARGGPAVGAMLGNKIFDYMGAGRCVVYCGPPGAVPSLLLESGGGLVLAEGDWMALAAAIHDLAHDPLKRDRMGRAGRDHVMGGLTADHSAGILAAVLQRAVDSSGGRHRVEGRG